MADVGPEVVRYFERRWQLVGKQEGLVAFRREGQAACILSDGDAQQLHVGANSEKLFAQSTTFS